MDSNPYNLPPLPPPGVTVPVPLQTLYDMDCADDSCERLEEMAENGMHSSEESTEMGESRDAEIEDY